jgi:PIN domain nuclease of toxin-antitoxin system
MSLLLDTHAAIWYLRQSREMSGAALKAVRKTLHSGERLHVSAVSLVEAIYLVERGRIPLSALLELEHELKRPESSMRVAAVDAEVAEAVYKIPRQSVPDMPDRIIAATALCRNLALVTRDARIQSAGIKTIW